jgi:ribulose-5-phosphate 4-epimerase/fuculose-1-phosphate aldolase
MVKPSSESLSHAVIYEVQSLVGCVFHVHSPEIWKRAVELKIPVTDPGIPYGTPEMAKAVQKIVMENNLPSMLSMGGHEDGIIAYGASLSETGLVLIQNLALARKATL